MVSAAPQRRVPGSVHVLPAPAPGPWAASSPSHPPRGRPRTSAGSMGFTRALLLRACSLPMWPREPLRLSGS